MPYYIARMSPGLGLPMGSVNAGPGSQGSSPDPSQEQGSCGHWDSCRHREPPWGQGWAKAKLGCGSAGVDGHAKACSQALAGPRSSRAGAQARPATYSQQRQLLGQLSLLHSCRHLCLLSAERGHLQVLWYRAGSELQQPEPREVF